MLLGMLPADGQAKTQTYTPNTDLKPLQVQALQRRLQALCCAPHLHLHWLCTVATWHVTLNPQQGQGTLAAEQQLVALVQHFLQEPSDACGIVMPVLVFLLTELHKLKW
jgi:hypothetical protein